MIELRREEEALNNYSLERGDCEKRKRWNRVPFEFGREWEVIRSFFFNFTLSLSLCSLFCIHLARSWNWQGRGVARVDFTRMVSAWAGTGAAAISDCRRCLCCVVLWTKSNQNHAFCLLLVLLYSREWLQLADSFFFFI